MQEIEKKPLRRFIDGLDSFFNDDTTYYAASLSFFTIFAILPIIALLIAITSNLEQFHDYLDPFLNYIISFINPSHSDNLIVLFKTFLSNSDKLGGIGIVYMLFVFTMFFKDFEYIVNKIHKAKRKSIAASFFFYLGFIVISPIIFALYIIINSSYNNTIFDYGITFIFAWGIFITMFKLTVNRHITMKAAVFSSLATLVALSVTKNLFVYYIIYNQTYSTIYGSMAILLFTFFWIYVSWIIYLYGVKLCHRMNMQELQKIRDLKREKTFKN